MLFSTIKMIKFQERFKTKGWNTKWTFYSLSWNFVPCIDNNRRL